MATSSDATPSGFAWASLEELRSRTSIKWRAHPDDVLPLWVAEMDCVLAPVIVEAVTAAVRRGDTGYPSGHVYAESLAAFARARWGWDGLALERTGLVPDVMMGAVEVLRLVTEPGDAVVINSPVYAPFYAFVSHSGRRVVESPLGADGRLDLQALERTFSRAGAPGGRVAYLLCNPHNPTGAVHTHEELAAVAELARRCRVRVVADEIHAPLVLPGARFVPYLTVPGSEDAFSLMSASKGWNLAGLNAALVIAGEEAGRDLRRMPEEVSHGASHVGVIAHAAAYTEGQGWLEDLIGALGRNRELLAGLLAEHLPEVTALSPQGTYLAWLDCRRLGFAERAADGPGVYTELDGPAAVFLERARVALSAGHIYGSGGAGHVRLNFACSPDVLTEAITRIGRALATGEHVPSAAVS